MRSMFDYDWDYRPPNKKPMSDTKRDVVIYGATLVAVIVASVVISYIISFVTVKEMSQPLHEENQNITC